MAASAHAKKPRASESPTRQEPPVTALDLPQAELTPAMESYFQMCRDKIGFVPNVLTAYAFDMAKLSFRRLLQRPDARAIGSEQARTRDDRGSSLLRKQMLLLPDGAWGGGAPALRRCGFRRDDGDELSRGGAFAEAAGDARLSVKVTNASYAIEESDRDELRQLGFSDRDIWDIAAVASFFNMSNRMASAVDMRPNHEYHAQAR